MPSGAKEIDGRTLDLSLHRMGIVRFLLSRPLLVKLLIFFIVILAVVSLRRLQRQGYPRVDMEKMNITTVYPGASPEDVELNVTIKIEEALKEVTGIEKYISRSMENASRIEVFIDPDAENKEEVKDDIRRAVEGVSDLPEEVEKKPDIFEVKVDNFSIYEVALSYPNGDLKTLRRHARALKKKLLEIEDVSRVNESGVREREIHILLNREKMNRHFVSFQEVIQAVRENKLRVSGGSLETYTHEKGIVTFSEFETPEDVGGIIVRASDLGHSLRIRDIGTIEDTFEKEDTQIRYNGNPGMSLWVAKKGHADIIKTVEEIKKTVDTYRTVFAPAGLQIFSTFDDSIETRNRLELLIGNAIAGFILVLLILFVFLDRTSAFWTAAGIPLSIALTIILMPVFGITINSISILGLVVVLGMVVDDAIIISESIYSARESGMSASEAALHGLGQVYIPVLGTIITTIIAFIPIYFIPGTIGSFSVEIPSVVIIMLLASLLEASTLLPAHLAFAPERAKEPPGTALIRLLEKKYRQLLQFMLHRRYFSMICFTGAFIAATALSFALLRFNMFPIDQSAHMHIYGETTRGSTLEFTADETKKLEKIITKLPAGVVHSWKTVIGRHYSNGALAPANEFFIYLILTPASTRKMKATDVRDFVSEEFRLAKMTSITNLNYFIDGGGPPVGKPLEIRVIGNNNESRLKMIGELNEFLVKLGATEVDSDHREGKDEVRLIPDYRRVAMAKLTVADIATTIRTAFDGMVVTHLQTPEEKIPFRVMLDDNSRDFSHPLRNLIVRNQYGGLVEASSLVREQKSTAPQAVHHYNGNRTNLVTANIDRDKTDLNTVHAKLVKFREEYRQRKKNNPDGENAVSLIFGGEAEESSKTLIHISIAISVAVIAIYFLLVMQFNSFAQPLMVILAIPFGFTGITLAFGIQGIPMSMLALIGILGFSGVVVNDSLIMVEFINRLRGETVPVKKGRKKISSAADDPLAPFKSAIIEGSVTRLRPIMLTTLTTMAGLVPTAYGLIGGVDHFISPMVMAMAWGLLTGTIAVLLIIPVLYIAWEDLLLKWRRRFPA